MAGGWKVACHGGRMIERYRVTSPGTLAWECEIRTRDDNSRRMAFFFCIPVIPPPPICYFIELYVLGRELSLTLAN